MMSADWMAPAVCIAIGGYLLLGTVQDWPSFRRNSRWLANVVGHTGARVFYGVLGLGLVCLGVAMLTGVVAFTISDAADV